MIDPMFESWRRRAQPTLIDQFANFYASHSAPRVDPGPLAVTREWTGLRNAALMRRGLDVARSQAALPLHLDTLAGLEAETWGAFLMSALLIELQGRLDNGGIAGQQRALLRLVAPLTQLMTGKQAVSVLLDLVDGLGSSAGAVDRSRLQQLLQDAQRRPAGEAATDALATEALSSPDLHDALAALMGARPSACDRSGSRDWWRPAGRPSARSSAQHCGWNPARSPTSWKPVRVGSR